MAANKKRLTNQLLNLDTSGLRRSLAPEKNPAMFQTPRKQPISSSRRSLAPSSSSSTLSSSKSSIDPRRLHDKKVQFEIISSILNYLPEIDPTSNFSALNLKKLTKPQFEDIVILLLNAYSLFYPLEKGKSFSDSLILILQVLGYPIKITKSRIETPGAPHALEAIIGISDFLKTLRYIDDKARENFQHTNEEELRDDNSNSKIHQGYADYTNNQKSLSEIKEELCDQIFEEPPEDMISKIKQEISEMQKKSKENIQTISKTTIQSTSLKEESPQYKENKQSKSEMLEKLEKELLIAEKENENLLGKKSSLEMEKNIISNIYTKVETNFKTLNIDKTELIKVLNQQKKVQNEIDANIELKERTLLSIKNFKEKREDFMKNIKITINKYNSICREASLIPITAPYAYNINYEAKINENVTFDNVANYNNTNNYKSGKGLNVLKFEEFFGVEMKYGVKMGVKNVSSATKKGIEEKEKIIVKLEGDGNTIKMANKQKSIELENKRKKVKDFEEFINVNNNTWEGQKKNYALEFNKKIFEVENEIAKLEEEENEVKEKIKKIEQEMEKESKESDKIMDVRNQDEMKFLKELYMHKYKVSKMIEKYKVETDDLLENVRHG